MLLKFRAIGEFMKALAACFLAVITSGKGCGLLRNPGKTVAGLCWDIFYTGWLDFYVNSTNNQNHI